MGSWLQPLTQGIQVLTEALTVLSQLGGGRCQQWHMALLSPFLLSFPPSFLSSCFCSFLPASFSSFIPSFFPPFFFPQTFNEPLLCSTSGKEPICQCKRLKRLRFNPWVRKMPGVGNATHSSILASSIPWREEPGRLQFICLQNGRT